jgi:hypothetical protein
MPAAGIAIIIPLAKMIAGNVSPLLTSLLYVTIVFSYLISPMHLCLILTLEYYKARLHIVYRKLIPAALAAYLIFLAIPSLLQNIIY